MKNYQNNRGFTLIELLLVVGIVAIILAVIVPLGLRARVDAKNGVVRQNGSELASFASQWVEKSIQAQDERTSEATVKSYYATLAGNPTAPANGRCNGQWIAIQTANNWNLIDGNIASRDTVEITGRDMPGPNGTVVEDSPPEDTVEDIIPPDKAIRNPFTEVNVFRRPNLPDLGVVAGALALGCYAEGSWVYFGFAFQSTDNTAGGLALNGLAGAAEDAVFHAGMGVSDPARLRNGIFLGRFN